MIFHCFRKFVAYDLVDCFIFLEIWLEHINFAITIYCLVKMYNLETNNWKNTFFSAAMKTGKKRQKWHFASLKSGLVSFESSYQDQHTAAGPFLT